MKKIILLVVVSLLGFLSSEECKAQYDSLKFGDYGVSSITPKGFSSVKGSIWVDVENTLPGFTVSNIEGKLYRNGVPMIQGHADDYYVPNGKSKVTITGVASLCPGISIFDVLGLVFFEAELYTVDIKAVITDDGAEPVIKEVKNMPVLKLLKKDGDENNQSDESKNSK